MKKLKKLSKNKKPKFILIYGPIGVGKLTVAQELQKTLKNFSLIHNHMILNLVEELFPRKEKTPHRADLIMKMYKTFIKEAVQKEKNIIMTHPYSHSFVYRNKITDPIFVKNMIKIFEKNNGIVLPIHLICDQNENIKRALNKKRRIHKKLVDKNKLQKIFKKEDHITSPKIKNNLKIDTTKLDAKKITRIIKNHFKL